MIKKYFFTAHAYSRLDALFREQLPLALAESKTKTTHAKNYVVSNAKIRRLIIAGMVAVNGSQCRIPSKIITSGCSVTAFIDEEKFFYEKQNDDIQFKMTEQIVLYEDDELIIVNKPANFPTEQTIKGNRANMHEKVIDWLQQKAPHENPPYVGIMHRLDRTTSGILLFTKTRKVNKAMHALFENRTIEKTYRAIVVPSKKMPHTFSVENYIGKIAKGKWGAVSKDSGRFAHTDFTILKEGEFLGKHALLIEAKPLTGRTHQIRVHLAIRGLPIFGDELYGGKQADRLYLHALSLSFPHPVTNTLLKITAPLPEQFMLQEKCSNALNNMIEQHHGNNDAAKNPPRAYMNCIVKHRLMR